METVLRVAVIYVFILVGIRLIGKREFSQLSPLELVSLLLVPEIVSQALQRDDYSVTNGLVGVATLFVLVWLTSLLMQWSKRIDQLIEASPTVLAHHGQLVDANLNKERVTPDEIFAEMRKSGLERLDQVRWAVLETDGKISIVPEDGQGKHAEGRKPRSKPPCSSRLPPHLFPGLSLCTSVDRLSLRVPMVSRSGARHCPTRLQPASRPLPVARPLRPWPPASLSRVVCWRLICRSPPVRHELTTGR